MELKQYIIRVISFRRTLLIVPYGIETWRSDGCFGRCEAFNRTLWNWNEVPLHLCRYLNALLIVPYGIETFKERTEGIIHYSFNRTLWNWNVRILIEPVMALTFNRTLWNWNVQAKPCLPELSALLIVPYGIETVAETQGNAWIEAFNRTLWNWNMSLHPIFSR